MSSIVITPVGEKLSSIIRNRMDEYFRKYNTPISNIYNSFSASNNIDVKSRENGILGHLSVAYGIQEFLTNYCNIPLICNGYSQGSEIAFVNENVSTVGLISKPNLDYFPLFMMPMTLRTDDAYLLDRTEAMKKLFRSILLWVSVPFLKANTYYLNDKFYFANDLVFGFGLAYDKLNEVVDSVLQKMIELKNINQLNYKTSWDATASGLCELLNLNEIYSTKVDVGVGAIYNGTILTALPLIPPYFGYTNGKAIFGTDYYVNLDLNIMNATLGLPDIKIPISVKVNPNFPIITYKDKLTQVTNSLNVNYSLDIINGSTTNILDNLEISIKQNINKECDFIYRKLKNESDLTDSQIVNEIIKIMETLLSIFNTVTDYLISNIKNYLDNLAKLMTRITRIITWSNSLKIILPYGYSIYLEEILDDFISTIDSINNVIDSIINSVDSAVSNFSKVGTETLVDIVDSQKVNNLVQSIYFPELEDVFSFDQVNNDYLKIASFSLLIGNVLKIVGEGTKVSNIAIENTANILLGTVKTNNQTAKGTPATAGVFTANEGLIITQKELTPYPQSDVNVTDPDYLIQSEITSAIKVAFDSYAISKKASVELEVLGLNSEISDISNRLQNGSSVYDL